MIVNRRPATSQDEAFLFALITGVAADELSAWSLPEALRVPLLEVQYRARLRGLEENFPDAQRQIILCDGEPAGWMVVAYGADEIRLVDIAVDKARRGAGIGTVAIQTLLGESRALGRTLRLTVGANNRALRLYQRLGFQRTGGDAVLHFMESRPGS